MQNLHGIICSLLPVQWLDKAASPPPASCARVLVCVCVCLCVFVCVCVCVCMCVVLVVVVVAVAAAGVVLLSVVEAIKRESQAHLVVFSQPILINHCCEDNATKQRTKTISIVAV